MHTKTHRRKEKGTTKPALAKETPNGRMYVHPVTGEAVFSVTTIIKNGIPKPELVDWAANTVAKYAVQNWDYLSTLPAPERLRVLQQAPEDTRDRAGAKGDAVHDAVEAYDGDPKGDPHLIQWRNFLDTSGFTIVEREVTLWNRTEGYAGTADWLAVDKDGCYVLGDEKTGNGVYPDYGLQVEALARCEWIVRKDGTEEELPFCERVGLLHLRPKSWWWYEIPSDNVAERNWEAFLCAKGISEWRSYHPSMTLGDQKWSATTWPS